MNEIHRLLDDFQQGRIDRRRFLRRGAALGLALPALNVLAASDGASAAKSSGSLNILMELVPETEYVQSTLPDFKKKTGIDVKIEKINYSVMHTKLVPELTAGAGSGAYDVIQVDIVWPREFVLARWLQDLSARVHASKLVQPGDFVKPVRNASMLVGGKPYMLPFYNYAGGFLYRQDLLRDPRYRQAYHKRVGGTLGVPRSLDEFAKWAEFWTALTGTPGGKAKIYGTVMTGRKGDNAFDWINYLYMAGGDFFRNRKPALTQPEAVHSLKVYAELMRKAAAPGTNATAFDEAFQIMSQGGAASFLTFLWMDVQLNDPKTSKVANKVKLATVPGKGGSLGSWGWGIPTSAPNADAAWKFIEYQSSFAVAKRRALMGSEPVRDDVYTDTDVLKAHPQYKVHYDIVKRSKGWPPEFQTEKALQTLSDEISQVQLGQKSAAEALATVAHKVPPLKA
jgi:multiple sugar transport system substrate-binding protein